MTMKHTLVALSNGIALIFASIAISAEELYVPDQVAVVYVILQKPGPLVDGSSETLAMVDRQEFIAQFQRYVSIAKNKNMRLIVTAATAGETQWIHSKITYKDAPLKPAMYRDPNQSKSFPGAEVPLD